MTDILVLDDKVVSKFNVTDAYIADLEAKFMPLKINGVDDKEGYALVRSARLEVKAKRVDVEKVRKDLKEDSVRFGRLVDAEAKRITNLLTNIESHLETQEQEVLIEKQRIKDEEIRLINERWNNRISALRKLDCSLELVQIDAIKHMRDEEYLKILSQAEIDYRKHQEDLAAQEAARKAEEAIARAKKEAEEKALAEERERQKIIAEQQRIAQEKIDAENARIQLEKQRLIDIENEYQREKAKAQEFEEAKERARIEAEQFLKAQQWEKEQREKEEAEELQRLEETKPDRVKLCDFANYLRQIELPSLKNPSAIQAAKNFELTLKDLANEIKLFASDLHKRKKA